MVSIQLYKKKMVKIPKTVDVLYCKKNNILVFKGFLKTKSLKINSKILVFPLNSCILVSSFFYKKNSKLDVKNGILMQSTYISKIQDILIEVNYNLYRKLNFIGVGYRAFPLENLKNQFYFKLGYSHLIYFRIPLQLNSYCIKLTRLFIFGNVTSETLNQTLASIRQCKKPEPYKGKGILYDGEKIKLKQGKKI